MSLYARQPGAQGQLRTFISRSHTCTFSINNVELKYVQSSLARCSHLSLPAPSARRHCLKTDVYTEPGLFPPHPGSWTWSASDSGDCPRPNCSVLSFRRRGTTTGKWTLSINQPQGAAPLQPGGLSRQVASSGSAQASREVAAHSAVWTLPPFRSHLLSVRTGLKLSSHPTEWDCSRHPAVLYHRM